MLTPSNLPLGTRAITLIIPDSEEWQAPVLGALLALLDVWRWKPSDGGVSVETTISTYLDTIWEALP